MGKVPGPTTTTLPQAPALTPGTGKSEKPPPTAALDKPAIDLNPSNAGGPQNAMSAPIFGQGFVRSAGVSTGGGASSPVKVVYVQGGNDWVTRSSRVWNVGEAKSASTVAGMVDSIIANANGHMIEKLVLVGHGSPGSQLIADGVSLRPDNIAANAAELLRLKPLFAKGAVVQLDGCSSGAGPNGEALVKALSELWGVEVRAAIVPQSSVLTGNDGTRVCAKPGPNGTEISVKRNALDGFYRIWNNRGWSADDKARAAIRDMPDDGVRALSRQARWDYARSMLEGWTVKSERTQLMRLFELATPEQRRELYHDIEKRDWKGHFVEGWLTVDDWLWDKMTRSQMRQLKEWLNEGSPAAVGSAVLAAGAAAAATKK
jgi:hypothetical protein